MCHDALKHLQLYLNSKFQVQKYVAFKTKPTLAFLYLIPRNLSSSKGESIAVRNYLITGYCNYLISKYSYKIAHDSSAPELRTEILVCANSLFPVSAPKSDLSEFIGLRVQIKFFARFSAGFGPFETSQCGYCVIFWRSLICSIFGNISSCSHPIALVFKEL